MYAHIQVTKIFASFVDLIIGIDSVNEYILIMKKLSGKGESVLVRLTTMDDSAKGKNHFVIRINPVYICMNLYYMKVLCLLICSSIGLCGSHRCADLPQYVHHQSK